MRWNAVGWDRWGGYLLKERVSALPRSPPACSGPVAGLGAGPAVASQLVGRRRQADDPVGQLTGREREVLALMAEGRSARSSAGRLFLSEYTAASR
jgi:Bacterial regulatory proteins, luxR family